MIEDVGLSTDEKQPFLAMLAEDFGGWPVAYAGLHYALEQGLKLGRLRDESYDVSACKKIRDEVKAYVLSIYGVDQWLAAFGCSVEGVKRVMAWAACGSTLPRDTPVNGTPRPTLEDIQKNGLITLIQPSFASPHVRIQMSLFLFECLNSAEVPRDSAGVFREKVCNCFLFAIFGRLLTFHLLSLFRSANSRWTLSPPPGSTTKAWS